MSTVARPASSAPDDCDESRFWFAAPRCWARGRWARASPRTSPMPAFPCCCWIWCRRAKEPRNRLALTALAASGQGQAGRILRGGIGRADHPREL